ncbi:sensor histidine kinase [Winogradskyella aurantiaca]|uniref:sensor histidine kinase n=1 Tax=Winogradskyella aurantiaca TaxID=2219558 RepID=UPI000E1DCB37|nr:HAMP domain-containing sensor histidine kinase [Winogradskyella aurantiaca]
MKTNTYRWILYGIATVILATITIQIYWNYKNYQVNKQQLYNDVQNSLDKAIDDYYAQLAEKSTLGLALTGESQKTALEDGGLLDQIAKKIDTNQSTFITFDSLDIEDVKEVQIFRGLEADSLLSSFSDNQVSPDSFKTQIKELKQSQSFNPKADFELLTSKIVISISNDTLEVQKVDSLFIQELNRKSIDVDYELLFYTKEDRFAYLRENKQWPEKDIPIRRKDQLISESKSTFLPDQSVFLISFSNTTKTLLGRIISGMLISLLLVIGVIATLFYLLKIIQNQKQMAEMKNDLISNITHEFKTPIATIGVALEGIQSFDILKDKEKTKSYLQMSTQQLSKLNLMVEKLLETASLDTNSLDLDEEASDLVLLLETICLRVSSHNNQKQIGFSSNTPSFIIDIDVFHFENAINNILDNAIKYGGDTIQISLIAKGTEVRIGISDNGEGIPSEYQKHIFDKFYRVPKGNTHDVKGFGIGLYYTKTIIERHGGQIELDSRKGKTTFNITLANVSN